MSELSDRKRRLRNALLLLERKKRHTLTLDVWGAMVLQAEQSGVWGRDERRSHLPLPPKPTRVLSQRGKMAVLSHRHSAGLQLYHPDDISAEQAICEKAKAMIRAGKFLRQECHSYEDDEEEIESARSLEPLHDEVKRLLAERNARTNAARVQREREEALRHTSEALQQRMAHADDLEADTLALHAQECAAFRESIATLYASSRGDATA